MTTDTPIRGSCLGAESEGPKKRIGLHRHAFVKSLVHTTSEKFENFIKAFFLRSVLPSTLQAPGERD